MRPWLKVAVYLVAGALIMVFFSAMRVPVENAVLATYFDSGHAIIFGLLAVLGLAIWKTATHRDRNWEGYAVVFLSVTVLGVITELLQVLGPRKADIVDILRNMAGTTAFLLVALAWEYHVSLSRKILAVAGAVALLAVVFFPAFALTAAFSWREQAYPNLVDFDSRWARPLWRVRDARVSLVAPPDSFVVPGAKVAKVSFHQAQYPRLVLRYPFPEWDRKKSFAFEVYSPLDSTQVLFFRIHDATHNNRIDDRYNLRFQLQPGMNVIRVPVEEIERGPEGRLMDLQRIESLSAFLVRPPAPVELYFSSFRLE